MKTTGLSPAAVSRRLGIAVTTLRTWHQRYGLGPTGHQAGRHRRYTGADLKRLDTMRRLTSEGVPAAQAAGIARDAPIDKLSLIGVPESDRRRAGGGPVIAVAQAGPEARGLASAARRLDVRTMRTLLRDVIAARGVVAAWTEVICPVLRGIGRRHGATGRLVDVEHLLSRCVSEALAAVVASTLSGPGEVMLTCADEEQHSLPLEALAAALAEQGVGCRLLGARVPLDALRDAVTRTGPAVVVMWAHTEETADPAQLTALLEMPGRPVLVAAAGPGWAGVELPTGVLHPAALADALDLVGALVRISR